MKRVVISGLGAISPLGIGARQSWEALLAGKSGISKLEGPEYDGIPSKVAGQIPAGEWEEGKKDLLPTGTDLRRTPLFAQYALAATKMAIADAQCDLKHINLDRVGVCVGSGIGGIQALYDNSTALDKGGYRKVSPLFVPSLLNNMAAGHISIAYGLRGLNHAVSTACTTGAHAIGDAFNFIRLGMADMVVAGSSEACIHPLAVSGFARAKSLATKHNDDPQQASRPFDKDRNGFVIGEGAAIAIVESLDHAKARNAPIYAEIVGYGMSGDAYHITAPADNGEGALRSMRSALTNANMNADVVDHVNAHATSTQIGDIAEYSAICQLADTPSRAKPLYVSGTKSATGHLLGAAGSLEAVFAIMAVKHDTVPPTRNLQTVDEALPPCDKVSIASVEPIGTTVNVALTNSFGFGGTNASLIFTKLT